MLPFLAIFFWFVPIIFLKSDSGSVQLTSIFLYIFASWFLLICIAALFADAPRKSDISDPEQDEKR